MFLQLGTTTDYDKEIAPFLRNGIILDTSVLWEIIDGLVTTRIGKHTHLQYDMILRFLDRIKVTNQWGRFYITPHILTETAHHLRNAYHRRDDYKKIVEEIMPILKILGEYNASKNEFIGRIDFTNPIIEAGDISIFVVADEFLKRQEKIAILSNDNGINEKYQDNSRIMIMDYRSAILNAL